MRVPLAWRQLSTEPRRMLVAVAGAAFAVVLMFMQLGFRDAMLSTAVRYHDRFDYDLVLQSPKTIFIGLTYVFPERRLVQALAVDGVQSVTPVYLQQQHWENPWTHASRNVLVVGIDPQRNVLDTPGVAENLHRVREDDVVLFDTGSRPEFGPVGERFAAGEEIETEIGNRRVRVGGLYELGSSFGIDGNVVTSELNFQRIFAFRDAASIDLGLVHLRAGVDPDAVRARLQTMLPNDVRVFTREAFRQRELEYWTSATPIGYVFGFGLVMGLVVGGIIVYQILFADVSDHLSDYATLKAIGYTNAAVSFVVLRQAVMLALLGFFPGLTLSMAMYGMASEAIRMPLVMTVDRVAGVFILTLVMCSAAGLLALNRLKSADPAEILS